MKILTIVGARPQFVKASAVSRAFTQAGAHASEVVVHTGQHFDDNMSDVFFRELEMSHPAYNLGIAHSSHGAMTGRMLESIEEVIKSEHPDWVLVYGDTNSTLAGALAAAKLHVPVAHIEAGLRSFNRRMPEEINRVLTDHCSDLLFAPTQLAMRNLQAEGVPDSKVELVGDVMYDVAQFYGEKAERVSSIIEELDLGSAPYILATIHRAENTDDEARLAAIFHALERISESTRVVLPLHPRTKAALANLRIRPAENDRFSMIDPVGYLDMIMLEKNANLLVTDSGGVQKEAFFYSVPCITLRDETEWQELVELGWNRVVSPTTAERIVSAIQTPLNPDRDQANPYGCGDTSKQIVTRLLAMDEDSP